MVLMLCYFYKTFQKIVEQHYDVRSLNCLVEWFLAVH